MKMVCRCFFWHDSFRRIYRDKWKFLLFSIFSFIMVCCIGGYTANLYTSRISLITAGENFPVKLQIYSKNGKHNKNLAISQSTLNSLLNLEISDVQFTSSGQAEIHSISTSSEKSTILAVNSETILTENKVKITWHNRHNSSSLEGSSAVCLISEQFLESSGISLGDILTLYIYVPQYDSNGTTIQYEDIGMHKLTIIGKMSTASGDLDKVVIPIKWLWEQERLMGVHNTCDSFKGVVTNPIELNILKSKIPSCGLGEINQNAKDSYNGTAVMFEDKKYIEYSEKMLSNISLLKKYRVPFFILVLLLVIIVTFLIVRSNITDLAISVSLGYPAHICYLSYFLSLLTSYFIGGFAAILLIWNVVSDPSLINNICLLSSLCIFLGVGLGLFFMSRKNVWETLFLNY